MKYPKIPTIWTRNDEFKVVPGQFRHLESAIIKEWLITEKIDGQNLRIMLFPDGHVECRGRGDKTQFHKNAFAYFESMSFPEKMRGAFYQDDNGNWPLVVVYGELYGPKIQKGGKYRSDITARIFDVWVNKWWIEWDDVVETAKKLQVPTVPILGFYNNPPVCKAELLNIIPESVVAKEESGQSIEPEGIVARTVPMLFTRQGARVLWKSKIKDF